MEFVRHRNRSLILMTRFALGCALICFSVSRADEPSANERPATPEQLQFFESRVRPLLVEHCQECHSGDKPKGALSLESREALLSGGDSGPAVVPNDPASSLLLQAVRYEGLEMPPKGKLSDEKIEILSAWVKAGAQWPNSGSSSTLRPASKSHEITEADRQHWAFQPVRPVTVPVFASAPHPIDAFITAQLQQDQLSANPRADTRTLVRRAYFGLTGLPPSYEELEAWTQKIGAGSTFHEDAYEHLLNDLLARPAYGEHWARHWLDVVRFAQSNGYERDGYKPYSWRYRDYVVSAFQQDKPYDRFVLEQLAGDELPDASGETRTATGFYRLGPWDDEPDDKRQAEFDEYDDVMVTIGASFLGLTIGCARCHDHKFDPIPQADYYRLLAFLRNVKRYDNPQTTLTSATSWPISDDAAIRRALEQLRARTQARDLAIASAKSEEERKKLESQPVDQNLTDLEWALAVREHAGEPPPTHVLIRGNAGNPETQVEPGFPEVLVPPQSSASAKSPREFRSESPLNDAFPSSGRRLALARWLTSPAHPLTARVIVNRVWHYHFGRGIVSTTGDFGKVGDPPSHPELLDWLANDFVEHGWSIKRLHRQILTSETYRRSSTIDSQSAPHRLAMEKDPGNRLLWRFPLRRLDAEAIRDRMLAASNELDPRVGGREMYPRLSGEVLAGQSRPGLGWESSPAAEQRRRSLYAVVKRSVRDPLLEILDYSNVTSPLTERPNTTVAPQALILLHGQFSADRALALAARIQQQSSEPDEQLRQLFRAVLQRPPTDREIQVAARAVHHFESDLQSRVGQISFRPDVPVSLYAAYRGQLPGEDFLIGPRSSWVYRSGVWGGEYEGIDVVTPRLGPHAFWQGGEFQEGVLSGQLRFESTVELITLMARSQPQGTAWQGLGITFDLNRGVVEWRDRTNAAEVTQSKPAQLTADQWLPFRWEVERERSRFWLGTDTTQPPLIESPITPDSPTGRIGVAVWGGQADFQHLSWQTANGETLDIARTVVSGPEMTLPTGWSRYDGDWQREADGTWLVSPWNGAKLIWDQQPLPQGEVRVEMQMSPGKANIGGILLCVSEPQIGADNWYGYEVSLDANNQTVMFGDHRHNFRMIRQAKVPVHPGQWHTLRVVIDERRLQVFVDDAAQPALDEALPDRLTGQLFGLRTWGSEIRYRNIELRRGGEAIRPEWPAPVQRPRTLVDDQTEIRRQALATLCRTLFNLNEFVYVD